MNHDKYFVNTVNDLLKNKFKDCKTKRILTKWEA